MASASEIGGYVSTATGLCLNLADFSPSWVVFQTILFVVSTGLAVFNTYTDWTVVLNFHEVGFDNPLLPRYIENNWLRAWFLFTFAGTVFTAVSICHDALVLVYTMHHSCKRHCYKPCAKHCCKFSKTKAVSDEHIYQLQPNAVALTQSLIADESENESDDSENQDEKKTVTNNDPCKSCYRCGCNIVTRNETLGAISLWFQDVPMLTIAVLYAFSLSTCKTPQIKNVGPVLQGIGISAAATTVTAIWKLARSFIRLYSSIRLRKKKTKNCFTKCLPKKSDVVYPPDTRTQHCIRVYYCGVLMQFHAVVSAVTITFVIWLRFGLLKYNFDDSIGIYRFSLYSSDVRLFNISNIIQPNDTTLDMGTFVNLEQIPQREIKVDSDIFCLSEFEYRSEESQLFFNTIQLKVLSFDGRFCVNVTSSDFFENRCGQYYTYKNFVLYYASINPRNGDIERYDKECEVIKNILRSGYSGPQADFTIDVTRHINRTGFPENNEPTIIFYPSPINIYVPALFLESCRLKLGQLLLSIPLKHLMAMLLVMTM